MFKPVNLKIDFPKLERKILDYWYNSGVVEKYLHRNDESKTRFSFLDGPITANNPMGVHHGWGRTYKDLWQRYFNMKGRKQRFQNGFDCQGLWVEVEVEKELGFKSKKDIEKYGIAKFVTRCKERVRRFAAIQTEQSKRLGYFMDWDNSYFTMSDENNYAIWNFLKVCWQNGWIYKGHEVVPWCPRCETAISQHEMLTEDYKILTHESVYLKLKIKDKKNEFLLIWTTTPWTIPANTAVAVDEDLDYSLIKTSTGEKYWLVKKRIPAVFGSGGSRVKIIKTVKGKKLVGLRYLSPYDHLPYVRKIDKQLREKFHTVIATDSLLMPISLEEGTGLVHTSTSTGEEDFQLGKKLGLPCIPAINDKGEYLEEFGELKSLNAKERPELILKFLKKNNWALRIEKYSHRYPVCWRCKTELVWKLADEWYIAMDRKPKSKTKDQRPKIPIRQPQDGQIKNKKEQDTRTLRERLIEVAKKIHWIPEFGLERELDWLKNMHDWLISKKNRYWGLALPIYECSQCGSFEVIGSREELKARAIVGWQKFEGYSPHKPWIDEVKIKCNLCQSLVSRIDDVGNPWLDAGIVAFSTYIDPKTKKLSYTFDKKYWRKWFPADFITESFPGQFKNWFYSLIVMSTVLENKPPFKTVLGFASLLGEDGNPMHKSLGNAIEFNEAADEIGVDVMRWMYVTQNPTVNLLFGYKKADDTRRKFHLILWNVYNFFVTYANNDGWSPLKNQKSKLEIKNILDEWIISKLNRLIKTVSKSLNNYDAYVASIAIEEFVHDLSTWYVRRSRERVGPTVKDEGKKIACHATLYEVLVTLAKLLAPFTPFWVEKIYQNLTGEESVHLADWPEVKKDLINNELEEEMKLVRKICELGHAERKKLKIKVRQPLKKLKIKNIKLKARGKKEKKELEELIKNELNLKELEWIEGKGDLLVVLDRRITSELKAEGEARELVRRIQLERKQIKCSLSEKVKVTLPSWPRQYTDYIKKETLTKTLVKGDKFLVKRI